MFTNRCRCTAQRSILTGIKKWNMPCHETSVFTCFSQHRCHETSVFTCFSQPQCHETSLFTCFVQPQCHQTSLFTCFFGDSWSSGSLPFKLFITIPIDTWPRLTRDEDEDDEDEHGGAVQPPIQRTQGFYTTFGHPPHSDYARVYTSCCGVFPLRILHVFLA